MSPFCRAHALAARTIVHLDDAQVTYQKGNSRKSQT
jgi:hypothetical protein